MQRGIIYTTVHCARERMSTVRVVMNDRSLTAEGKDFRCSLNRRPDFLPRTSNLVVLLVYSVTSRASPFERHDYSLA